MFLSILNLSTILNYLYLTGSNITVITALANTSVSLPCDISLPNNHEKVTLILWYREDLGVPIYR